MPTAAFTARFLSPDGGGPGCLCFGGNIMREIKKIIVHCSDSYFGDVKAIDAWHKARGWRGIGYHLVITNGVIDATDRYDEAKDGLIQEGRPIEQVGAHCKGKNRESIGVCLIGKTHFSARQLYYALPKILTDFLKFYELTPNCIFGHRDFNVHKTCPNIETELIRRMI